MTSACTASQITRFIDSSVSLMQIARVDFASKSKCSKFRDKFYFISPLFSFLQLLLPCTDNFQRNLTLDRRARHVGPYDSLPFDIERGMVEILQKEIDLQRRLDVLKGSLEYRWDYSPLAAFRSVDRYNSGIIDTYNLR